MTPLSSRSTTTTTLTTAHGVPQWITIDQLASWLKIADQFAHVDVYSFLSKSLSFVALYGTPEAHQGLCIIAADPNRSDCARFNEIFIARIPYDVIQEENRDKDFEAVKEQVRKEIGKLSLDIMQNSTVALSQAKLTWVTNKAQVGVLVSTYFSSNGFLPNSCHPNPEWKKQGTATAQPSSPPASPPGLHHESQDANTASRSDQAPKTHANKDTPRSSPDQNHPQSSSGERHTQAPFGLGSTSAHAEPPCSWCCSLCGGASLAHSRHLFALGLLPKQRW